MMLYNKTSNKKGQRIQIAIEKRREYTNREGAIQKARKKLAF